MRSWVISSSQMASISDFLRLIKEKQLVDSRLKSTSKLVGTNLTKEIEVVSNGMLRFRKVMCIYMMMK